MLKKNKGFTLIELLVSLSIIGIILSTAIPNLVDFINRTKSEAITDGMYLDLQSTRTLALSSGESAMFKMSSSMGIKNWSIVQNGKTLKTMPVKAGDFSFMSSTNGYGNFEVVFSPDGLVRESGGGQIGLSFLYACDRKIKEGKYFQINALGRISEMVITC